MIDSGWTERQHWVVMEREAGSEPRCVGHWPTRSLADGQAAQGRIDGERRYVDRTAPDPPGVPS